MELYILRLTKVAIGVMIKLEVNNLLERPTTSGWGSRNLAIWVLSVSQWRPYEAGPMSLVWGRDQRLIECRSVRCSMKFVKFHQATLPWLLSAHYQPSFHNILYLSGDLIYFVLVGVHRSVFCFHLQLVPMNGGFCHRSNHCALVAQLYIPIWGW